VIGPTQRRILALLPDDAPVSIPTLVRELGVDRRTVDSECQPVPVT
jgi:hypothetical protein